MTSTPSTFPTPVQPVRIFSDDGSSEWVDVIVPGFGRCQVQRDELQFNEASTVETSSSGLTSLTLSFEKLEWTFSDGLPDFFSAVGPSLKSLTLDVPNLELNEREIIELCPNLDKLSLCARVVDIQFYLSDYHPNDESSGDRSIDCHSVKTLSRDLSNMRNPLVKTVCQLRVYPSLSPSSFASEMKYLERMLKMNRSLEYLEVVALEEHQQFIEDLRKQHLRRVNRSLKLSTEKKIAFLNVLSSKRKATEGTKKSKSETLSSRSALCKIDRHVPSLFLGLRDPLF